jgi:2'-5' RNA ligase
LTQFVRKRILSPCFHPAFEAVNTMIRTFIAVSLSENIRAGLGAWLKPLVARRGLPVRWTAAENMHLTLKFLGDVEEKRLPVLRDALAQALASCAPFALRIAGFGAFPKIERARVLWVGCEIGEEGMAVQSAVEKACVALGFPKEDKPFRPHLTVGRVREGAGAGDYAAIAKLIRETPADGLGEMRVTEVRVYKSELLPGGAKYSVLYAMPLLVG